MRSNMNAIIIWLNSEPRHAFPLTFFVALQKATYAFEDAIY